MLTMRQSLSVKPQYNIYRDGMKVFYAIEGDITRHVFTIRKTGIEMMKLRKKLAKLLLDTKVEKIVMIGRRTKRYTAPLLKDKCDFESFDKPQAALKYLEKNLTGKETVIFKGSQYLEWIIEKLLENPEDAAKLCRREKAAIHRRKKWGLD